VAYQKFYTFFCFWAQWLNDRNHLKTLTMCGNKIKTYSKGQSISKHHFFILSKGLNAGKPLTEPCPNCFVFHAENEQEKDFYYWLVFCLW